VAGKIISKAGRLQTRNAPIVKALPLPIGVKIVSISNFMINQSNLGTETWNLNMICITKMQITVDMDKKVSAINTVALIIQAYLGLENRLQARLELSIGNR